MAKMPECSHCKVKAPFYQNKTFITASILAASILLSYAIPILVPFRDALLLYFSRIWWLVAIGLFLGGIIDHYVPKEYISHILAKPKSARSFIQ